jgi:hypothetical protein
LMRNVSIPVSSFATVTEVMSGACGSSPVESWNVAVFDAGEAALESAPDAIVGSAKRATVIARTRPGRISARTVASG